MKGSCIYRSNLNKLLTFVKLNSFETAKTDAIYIYIYTSGFNILRNYFINKLVPNFKLGRFTKLDSAARLLNLKTCSKAICECVQMYSILLKAMKGFMRFKLWKYDRKKGTLPVLNEVYIYIY